MDVSCACPACGTVMTIPKEQSAGEVLCTRCERPFIASVSRTGGLAPHAAPPRPAGGIDPSSPRHETPSPVAGASRPRAPFAAHQAKPADVPMSHGPLKSRYTGATFDPLTAAGGADRGRTSRRSPAPPSFTIETVTEVSCPACGSANKAQALRCQKCRALLLDATHTGETIGRPLVVTLLGWQNALIALLSICVVVVLRTQVPPTLPLPFPFPLAHVYACLVGLAALTAAMAHGLWKLRPWARMMQIVLAVPGLLGFPLMTLLSAVVILYLVRPETRQLFSGGDLAELPRSRRRQIEAGTRAGPFTRAVVTLSVGLTALSAIAIPAATVYAGRVVRNWATKQQATVDIMNALARDLERYKQAKQAYPTAHDLEDLVAQLEAFTGTDLPEVDAWGRPFAVEVKNGGSGYRLVSHGIDGQPGPGGHGSALDQWFAQLTSDIAIQDGRFRRWPSLVTLPDDAIALVDDTAGSRSPAPRPTGQADGERGSSSPPPGPPPVPVPIADLRKYYGQPLQFYLRDGTKVKAVPRRLTAGEVTVDQFFDSGAMTFPIPIDNIIRVETIPGK